MHWITVHIEFLASAFAKAGGRPGVTRTHLIPRAELHVGSTTLWRCQVCRCDADPGLLESVHAIIYNRTILRVSVTTSMGSLCCTDISKSDEIADFRDT